MEVRGGRVARWLALWVLSPSAALASAGVYPVATDNLTEGEAAAIGVWVAAFYGADAGVEVHDPRVTGAALEEHGSREEAARALGADRFVRCSAARLEDKILLQCTELEPSGDVLHQAHMVAHGVDDLPDVCQRVAKALVYHTDTEQQMSLATISNEEATPQQRVWMEQQTGMRLGVLGAMADGEAGALLTMSYDVRFSGRRSYIELAPTMLLPTPVDDLAYGALGVDLGVGVYSADANVSAYVGGGLSTRVFVAEREAGVTAAPYGHLGAVVGRFATARFYAEYRVSQHVLPVADAYPTEVGVLMGVAF